MINYHFVIRLDPRVCTLEAVSFEGRRVFLRFVRRKALLEILCNSDEAPRTRLILTSARTKLKRDDRAEYCSNLEFDALAGMVGNHHSQTGVQALAGFMDAQLAGNPGTTVQIEIGQARINLCAIGLLMSAGL